MDRDAGFFRTFGLDRVSVGVCGVECEAECFEISCVSVVWEKDGESSAECGAGGVSDGFVEVDDLGGECIKEGALLGGGVKVVEIKFLRTYSEVVDVNGGVDEVVVVESLEQYCEK